MKTKDVVRAESLAGRFAVRSTLVVFWAVALVIAAGCKADKVAQRSGQNLPLAEAFRLEIGSIAIVCPSQPARFGFDKARGRIAAPGERAGDLAGAVLGAEVPDPFAQLVLSPATLVATPLVAAGAAATTGAKLPPDRLTACESNLIRSMAEAAVQQRFRDAVLTAASEKTRRHFILVDSWPPAGETPRVDAVLETEIEDVRLDRIGRGDTSFALFISTHTRLVRTADSAVLFDRSAEFRSGTCLFVDWTLAKSFSAVADTAYHSLAGQVVEQLFTATPEGPAVVGAGFNRSLSNTQMRLAAAAARQRNNPAAQFVSLRETTDAGIDVSATTAGVEAVLQQPLTRDQAATQAVKDLDWALDGLQDHPNVVVSVLACATALPIGLWKQANAVVRGVSPKQLRTADSELTAVMRDLNPREQLAACVAQSVATQCSQPVALVRHGYGPGAKVERVVVSAGSRLPATVPVRQMATARGANRNSELEIHIVTAALAGKGGVNPTLALCVEGEARWRRPSDGAEIFSCPVRYRGKALKYTEWGADGAREFRAEWERCFAEMATAVTERLVSRGLIGSGEVQPVLAGN